MMVKMMNVFGGNYLNKELLLFTLQTSSKNNSSLFF